MTGSTTRLIAPRIRALNDELRGVSARTGAILVDFAACTIGSDSRIWSGDRIHAHATGHARIAHALAHAIGLPGADDSWRTPLPTVAPKSRLESFADEWNWARRHLLPWIGRGLRLHPANSPRDRGELELQLLEPGRSRRIPLAGSTVANG